MADNFTAWLAIAAFFAAQGVLYIYAPTWLTIGWIIAILAALPALWRDAR